MARFVPQRLNQADAKLRGPSSRRSVKIPLRCKERKIARRRPHRARCFAALLVSLLSSCRIASAEPGSPRIQCGCVMLFDPWPRHEHHTVAHAHHRQPGRRRSRQTHPRRHALRTLGNGQQPDTPASLAARALSRDGVRGSASTWGSIRIASSMERTMWPVTPDQ